MDLREIFAVFKAQYLASLLILKKGKVSSLGEKFPAPNYENLIQNRLLREDNLRRRECEDHFLDSFVTQAEIEGFVVALDGNLQRTYGRL